MRTEENEAGGISVVLDPGDKLSKVPRSHRELLTPLMREIFADPVGYFTTVVEKCTFPAMAAWLNALLEDADWAMVLHRGWPESWTATGIRWLSMELGTAEIGPPSGDLPASLPAAMERYYSLVSWVNWMSFGCAGGLVSSTGREPLTQYHYEEGAEIDPEKAFIFGSSQGGDHLFYTQDGRGGWLGAGSGKFRFLGSIDDTINWVFSALLAGRLPDYHLM